jgi:hypothetical protein
MGLTTEIFLADNELPFFYSIVAATFGTIVYRYTTKQEGEFSESDS